MGELELPKREKLLLIAYRAFGDWLYSVPILPFLFEKYDVYLECNHKVSSLSADDPRFKGITVFDDTKFIRAALNNKDFDPNKALQVHLQGLCDRIHPDRVIDLSGSHEKKCIATREQKEFFATQEERKQFYGRWEYYESVFDHVGLPLPEKVKLDCMYFTEQQKTTVKAWRDRHVSDFVVIIPPLGSCMQKFYPRMTELIGHIVDTYHNAHVYLMGEAGVTEGSLNHPRVHDTTGKLSMKQSILMTKYADYVIGPETGLLVAAGMWGTPKTMLCNTTAVHQTCGRHENDYSLQSSAKCSPCHRGVYREVDCDDVKHVDNIPYSACAEAFEFGEICEIIKTVYDKKNIYNKEYFNRFSVRAKTELGKIIYASRWELIEKHCHGELSLLDYGCASGAFHQSSRNGFIASGYDLNPNSPFHEMPGEQVDILTMWDVIEHLHDPSEPIRKFKPKYIFLSTPNLHEGVDFNSWKHNRPGEHLFYFNKGSLTNLLEGLGYEVREVNYNEGELRDPTRPKDIITFVAVRI